MRTLLLFCAGFLASPFSLAAENPLPGGPPKAACGKFQTSLGQEFKDWALGPLTLSTAEGKEGTLLPLNKRLKLLLGRGKGEGFGAVMPVRVATTAVYKIATGDIVGLEIKDKDGAPLAPASRESEAGCDRIRQVVNFRLDGGKDYALHLNGAPKSTAEVMISKQL